MRRGAVLAAAAGAIAIASAIGCAPGDPCDDLAARLDAARAGDTVVVDGCRVEVPLAVPAGVTLEGRGGATVAVSDAVAIEVLTANTTPTTTVRGLTVESGGPAGIAVRGVGPAAIEQVVVRARRGVAVGSDGAALTVIDTELLGEVTEADRDDARWLRVVGAVPSAGVCPAEPCECTPGSVDGTRACDAGGRWATLTATHGIYVRGGSVTIERTRVTGLALAAIVLDATAAILREVDAGAGLGVGIESIGGTLDADDVEVADVWSGLRGSPSYGSLFAGGAEVVSASLVVRDVDGYGVVHAASRGAHRDLEVLRAGDVAVWAGAGDLLDIAGGRVEGAAFAGVLAVDLAMVRLVDVDVVDTRAVRRVVGVRGAIDVGDGVQLVGSVPRLERVVITGSERAGLLVDLPAGTGAEAFTDVRVESAGAGLGAIAGAVDRLAGTVSGGAAAGWDAGITRAGAAIANDPAFTGTLDAVVGAEPPSAAPIYGAIGPMY